MGNIHRYPVPCLFNIQSPLWPVHGCWIDRLTLFTFSDDGSHCALRDPRGNLFDKIKCLPTRMTALSVNNLDLVKPNWAHGRSAGRLHRLSVPFNCIKPPLRHSSQSICLILARFDYGHIHRQRVFFHQFYYGVKLPSNEQMLAALLCTLALPVRVSEIHLWTQVESVNKCKVVVFQRIAKFIPLIMASSSARLMCWESFAGRNQQVSSTIAPSYTSNTPVARELASTHTLRAWPSTYHLSHAGSSLRTLMRTSLIMVLWGVSSILSSHPAVMSDALRLMNTTATWSQPPTGRCPMNLPHSENVFRREACLGFCCLFSNTESYPLPRPVTQALLHHSVASPAPWRGGRSCRDAPSHMPQAQCSRLRTHHQYRQMLPTVCACPLSR